MGWKKGLLASVLALVVVQHSCGSRGTLAASEVAAAAAAAAKGVLCGSPLSPLGVYERQLNVPLRYERQHCGLG